MFKATKGKTGQKRKRDRVEDLVDLGDGYDLEDSFIDNTDAVRNP